MELVEDLDDEGEEKTEEEEEDLEEEDERQEASLLAFSKPAESISSPSSKLVLHMKGLELPRAFSKPAESSALSFSSQPVSRSRLSPNTA